MAIRTDELELRLHRLSNYVECQMQDIVCELLAHSRGDAVTSLCWSGCRFIESLREIRDGKEGGDA
jgi:hypothetical protein